MSTVASQPAATSPLYPNPTSGNPIQEIRVSSFEDDGSEEENGVFD